VVGENSHILSKQAELLLFGGWEILEGYRDEKIKATYESFKINNSSKRS